MQIESVILNQKAISRIEIGERVIADYELLVFSRILGTSVNILLNDKQSNED